MQNFSLANIVLFFAQKWCKIYLLNKPIILSISLQTISISFVVLHKSKLNRNVPSIYSFGMFNHFNVSLGSNSPLEQAEPLEQYISLLSNKINFLMS